jgi:heterodisulfide reductase subunit B
MQFSKIQKRIIETRDLNTALPCVLYPQLLGLCLGIDREVLGFEEELPEAVRTHLRDIEPEASHADEQAV